MTARRSELRRRHSILEAAAVDLCKVDRSAIRARPEQAGSKFVNEFVVDPLFAEAKE